MELKVTEPDVIELKSSASYAVSKVKSVSVNGVSIAPDESGNVEITIPADVNTTYTLSKSGDAITLTGSDGSTSSVTDSDTAPDLSDYALKSDIPTDTNTTYTLSKSDDIITLTGSDGSVSSVTDADTHPYAPMIVNLTEVTVQGLTAYTADHTIAEIKAAFDAGVRVLVVNPTYDEASAGPAFGGLSFKYYPAVCYGHLYLRSMLGLGDGYLDGMQFVWTDVNADMNNVTKSVFNLTDVSAVGMGELGLFQTYSRNLS